MAVDTDDGPSSPLSSPPPSDCSSPLSEFSNSPSPPPEDFLAHLFPTPPASQQTSQSGSPSPDGMDSSANTDTDGPRPTKRRRISKERSTEYLDLRSTDIDPDQQEELDQLLRVLHKRQKIVVIAGAGISVSAGIPDFRSSTGLFRSLKEDYKLKGSGKHLFDASVYKDDTATSSFHEMVSSMSRLTKDAKPTAFHHMLATLASEDRLLRLYSQNVDSIDTSLEPLKTYVPLRKDDEGKWPRTVQLHGGLDKMVCSKCHSLSDFEADLFSGPVPPLCPRCEEINDIRTNHEGKRSHGIGRLRPRMVLYNEHNPDDLAIGTVTREDLRKRPDAVIVAGTTLKVPGVRRIVREMCGVVRDRRGGVAIWINNDLPPVAKELEDCFDIVVQGPCDEVARRAAMRKWDDPVEEDTFKKISDDEAEKAHSREGSVHIPKCTIPHANPEPLPSERHFNNSFRPPSPTGVPRIVLSPDFSPMCSRTNSIYPSIEQAGDNIDVNSTGLLTPTKSQKNSPAKKLPSVNEKLKDAAKAKKATGKAAVAKPKPKKPSTVKYVKPYKAKAEGAQKGPGRPPKTKSLTDTFKLSKAKNTGATKKLSPANSPSKLRQVSNASEPMNPLPPQDARNNTSPLKARPNFPNLVVQSENAVEHKKTSIAAIMN